MFCASFLTFKDYLSRTELVELCKVYLLPTGVLDWTACLYQSDHDQSNLETETYLRNDENLALEYQPKDKIHPPTPAARPDLALEYQPQHKMHYPTPTYRPDPVESIYFRTELYMPLPRLKIMGFEEYAGVLTGLGQRVLGIYFWADFGKENGKGHVLLPPKMSAKSIPLEAQFLVQWHLDTARSLIPIDERQYLKDKYGFNVEDSLVLS